MSQRSFDDDSIKEVIREVLRSIAPEVEFSSIRPNDSLRDQVELDSMDYLNLMVGIHQRLGVDIPEADYAKLNTLDATVKYLLKKLRTASAGLEKKAAS